MVLASATPAIETRVNAETGRYRWLRLPSRFGAATMPALATVDLKREGPPRGRWLSPKAIAGIESGLGRARAGAPLPQPARLCAPHPLPFLRPPFRVPQLRRVAGRAPLPRRARLPPLRPCRAAAEPVPGMSRRRQPRGLRTGRRTAGGRGGAPLSRRAHARAVVRLSGRRSRPCAGNSTPPRAANSTFLSARSSSPRATIFRCSPSSAWWTPTSASPTPIRAPPSAPSSFCARRPGEPGRAEREGHALLQTWQPDHPVMQALVSGDAERFYAQETEQRRIGGLPPFGRLAAIVVSAEDKGAAEAHARALARAAHAMPAGKGWRVAPLGGERRARRDRAAWAQPRRRSRFCAGATGSASPLRRRGRRICRGSCAPFSPPPRRRAAA